jgi:hypothetical protein
VVFAFAPGGHLCALSENRVRHSLPSRVLTSWRDVSIRDRVDLLALHPVPRMSRSGGVTRS